MNLDYSLIVNERTFNPTITNDETENYGAYRLWVNTVDQKYFLSLDQTAGNAVWDDIGKNFIFFKAFDFDKDNVATPDTRLRNVLSYGSVPLSIRVWQLQPSSNSNRKPLQLQFKLPSTFHNEGHIELDLHLLTSETDGSGSGQVRITAYVTKLSNNTSITDDTRNVITTNDGSSFTEFNVSIPSGGGNAITHYREIITFTSAQIASWNPYDWIYLIISRESPTMTEFNDNIYFSEMTFCNFFS